MIASRRLRYSAAVLTAFALAGCWGGTPVTPPAPPAVAPTEQAPPAAPVSDEFTTLQGQVALRGMPWANAKLQVVDAVSGKAVGTPGTSLRADGTMQTDAAGNFSIRVAGLAPGKVARLIATLDSGTLTALVGNEGPFGAAYAVQATGFTMKVTEISLCLDQVASGVLRMAGGLKSEAAAGLIKTILQDLSAMAPKLEEAFKADDMLAITMSLTADPATGLVTNGVSVTNVLAKAGLSDAINTVVKTATSSVAQLAMDKLNVADATALENVNLIGTSLKIAIEGGVFKVTDPATGETITVNLPAVPTIPVTTTNNTSSGGRSSSPSVAFAPVATFDVDTDTIRLKVTQAASESDIDSIVVRVPVVQAIGAVQVQNLDQANPADSITAATGSVQIGNIASFVLSVATQPNGSLGFNGLPTAPFGVSVNYGAGIEKEGTINVATLSNAQLGNVRVLTGDDTKDWWQAEYVYVAAKYTDQPEFRNATSLITAHGHTTTLDFTLPAGVQFQDAAVLDIKVRVSPRSPGAVAKTVTATYNSSVL